MRTAPEQRGGARHQDDRKGAPTPARARWPEPRMMLGVGAEFSGEDPERYAYRAWRIDSMRQGSWVDAKVPNLLPRHRRRAQAEAAHDARCRGRIFRRRTNNMEVTWDGDPRLREPIADCIYLKPHEITMVTTRQAANVRAAVQMYITTTTHTQRPAFCDQNGLGTTNGTSKGRISLPIEALHRCRAVRVAGLTRLSTPGGARPGPAALWEKKKPAGRSLRALLVKERDHGESARRACAHPTRDIPACPW